MKASAAILAAALALAFAGCGGDDAATGSDEKDAGAATASEEKDAQSATAPAPREPRFPTPATPGDPHFPTISYDGKGGRAKPVIEPSELPPPKQLLVKDLRVGTGPIAYQHDEAAIWYIDFNYKTGKEVFTGWGPPASPLVLAPLGAGKTFVAMEEGIEGMRVGGRREMLVPARRAFGTGALVVMVDLVSVEPAEASGGG
jgi:peptidylprolyl isomerase